jgi:isopentenyl diphosphate isomerase/L-lactate dehydrogenase-like FMN-dependent dehydrogenase
MSPDPFSRRRFLSFLAGSPLLAAAGLDLTSIDRLLSGSARARSRAGVAGRVPIIVDSGFRRGTDIFKGLALGATAVGHGRPYVWGLAAFGQEGVETVLALLRRELDIVMRQAGTVSVKRITREYVVPRGT